MHASAIVRGQHTTLFRGKNTLRATGDRKAHESMTIPKRPGCVQSLLPGYFRLFGFGEHAYLYITLISTLDTEPITILLPPCIGVCKCILPSC